ncbi:hypothetical protein [Neisseria sp. Ec49-e6-T10]|uniref:hypothetical protein n=1 Tax=Neisseria sp. Ec49-e6-T10 TaxID=3140744 RepID=UPI003EBFE605
MYPVASDKEQILIKAWRACQGSSPIAVFTSVIQVTNSLKAAIFLSQLIYWTKHGSKIIENDGWIFKQAKDITRETGLSLYEQDTIKKSLVHRGLIEVKNTRINMLSTLGFKVNLQKLGQQLAKVLQVDFDGSLNIHNLRNNPALTRRFFARSVAYHRDLAFLTKDINAAVMLSVAFRNIVENHTNQKPLLISITIENWQRYIGLTHKEQYRARMILKDLKLLKEKHLEASRRIFWVLNGQALLSFFSQALPTLLKEQPKNSKKSQQSLINSLIVQFTTSECTKHDLDQPIENKDNNLCHPDSGKGQIRNEEKVKLGFGERENKESGFGEIKNREKGEFLYKLDYKKSLDYNYYITDHSKALFNGQPSVVVGVQSFIASSSSPTEQNNSNKQADVSTTPDLLLSLHWPRQLTNVEREPAITMFHQLLADKSLDTFQLLLDEISGNNSVRNALGLLRKLITLHNEQKFFPTVALKVQQVRLIRAANFKKHEDGPKEKESKEPRKRTDEEKAKASMHTSEMLASIKTASLKEK